MPLDDLFAKTPRGKNSLKTAQLYNEKRFYYNDVYPGGNLPWIDKPFDFINENPLYGKVDQNGNYIIPKQSLINNIPQYERILEVNADSSGVRVFDFVAEAYNDLKSKIELLVRAGHLSAEGPIAKFEAKKGFVGFENINKLQKNIHYFMFVSTFLSAPSTINGNLKYKELIYNASDFVNFFLLYLKQHAKTMPFTKSGISNAFYMTPMSTGLCLEIDDKLYDDDQKKHSFLKDPNFNVYRILARRYGFMVDRNVPWRLVADVQSFKMREYMRLAYERDLISERQTTIKEKAAKDIKELLDESWDNDVEAIKTQAAGDLQQVGVMVGVETHEFWEYASMYTAKDPQACSGSPPLKLCQSRVFKLDKFFEVYYDVTYLDEIEDIKKTFYEFFLSYYVHNPTVKKKVLCSNSGAMQDKFVVKEIDLELTSKDQYNKLYSNYYWLKVYFDIKLAENNIKLKPDVYNKHLKKIIDLSTLNTDNAALNAAIAQNCGMQPEAPGYQNCKQNIINKANKALALNFINKTVRKKMKGLEQIYGDKGAKKEQLIGQMLLGVAQEGITFY